MQLHSVEITEMLFHAFWQKFRESNGFATQQCVKVYKTFLLIAFVKSIL